jgi:hypothetical protein
MCNAIPSTPPDAPRETVTSAPRISGGATKSYYRGDPPAEASTQKTSLNKARVAALTGARIDEMDRDELVRAIKAAHIPWIRAPQEPHLAMYDIGSLRRLVYLSRRICRNQGY